MSLRPVSVWLAAVITVLGSGCGSPATTQPRTEPLTLDITIAHGAVTPTNAQLQAKTGQPVVLRVSSDADDELHVHSTPDHTFPVEPRPGQTFRFSIDVPGRVDVELHHLDRTVATIQVTP